MYCWVPPIGWGRIFKSVVSVTTLATLATTAAKTPPLVDPIPTVLAFTAKETADETASAVIPIQIRIDFLPNFYKRTFFTLGEARVNEFDRTTN